MFVLNAVPKVKKGRGTNLGRTEHVLHAKVQYSIVGVPHLRHSHCQPGKDPTQETLCQLGVFLDDKVLPDKSLSGGLPPCFLEVTEAAVWGCV